MSSVRAGCVRKGAREIRAPCTGSGLIRGRGEQRRRRGGARSRATSSDSRPLSERSVRRTRSELAVRPGSEQRSGGSPQG